MANNNRKTLTEQFNSYVGDNFNDIEKIINFLAKIDKNIKETQNEWESCYPDEEIIEFYKYFTNTVLTKELSNAIFNKWKNGPKILRFGSEIENEIIEDEFEYFDTYLSEKQKEDAEKLADILFNMRKDRTVVVYNNDDVTQWSFEKNIPKDELGALKFHMLYLCYKLLAEHSIMLFYYIENNVVYMYSFDTTVSGFWVPKYLKELMNEDAIMHLEDSVFQNIYSIQYKKMVKSTIIP